MGMNINTAYNQLLTNAASVKGTQTGADRAKGAESKTAKASSSYSSGVKAEFSGEGLAALSRANKADKTVGTSEANEARLSDKAKKFLEGLREKYGDYDFMVGDENDDLDDLMSDATKEFSVVLSNEELEKMADDEEYAKEKMDSVEKAVDVAKKLAAEIGAGETDENGVSVGTFFNRFGIALGEDGKISIFADLERITAKQQENAEKAREERAEAKKEEEEQAEEKKVDREDYSVKLTRIEGSTADELIEKFRNIDWESLEEA